MFRDFNFYAEKPSSMYRRCDLTFLILTLVLWMLGIFTLYFGSAGSGERVFDNQFHFVQRQLISSSIGFVLMVFFAWIGTEKLRKILPAIVIGTFVLCLLTFIPGIGVERNGARRWIVIPYFSTFQPSEAAKIAVVLFLANLFDKQAKLPKEEQTVLPSLLGLMAFVLIIFCQQDFSTGFFIFIIGLLLFFISGAKLKWFIPLLVLGTPAAALVILLKPYRVNRIIGFFEPDAYQQTFNYQVNAAKNAISAGGFWGQGIGSGLSKINSVPEIQSDYIFTAWAEAMGFFGVIVYVLILAAFAWRGVRISMTCGDRFLSIVSFGFTAVITAQSLVNIGVVSGALPSTGIPLPFFSSGGSSIMCTLAMCGFILNASRIENYDDIENMEIYVRG